MKTKMHTNKVVKQDEFIRLCDEFSKIEKTARSKYNDRVYMNLPVTRLERIFFKLIAERMSIDKTKLLRRIIRKLMDKFPSIVAEAKDIVDVDGDIE